MAVRVTASEVKEIIEGCTTSDAMVDIMIEAASEVVTQVFEDDEDIGTTLLKEIERWLTAHMVVSTVFRMGSEEKVGDAQIKYTGQWGKKLESTPYGQMVLLLDTTGKMARSGKIGATISAIKSFD
jgi:hypothetical protein